MKISKRQFGSGFQPLFLCISLYLSHQSFCSEQLINTATHPLKRPVIRARLTSLRLPLTGLALSNAGWFDGLPLVSSSVCCCHSMFASVIPSSDFFQGSVALICVKN